MEEYLLTSFYNYLCSFQNKKREPNNRIFVHSRSMRRIHQQNTRHAYHTSLVKFVKKDERSRI